jgi:hypothetical protein
MQVLFNYQLPFMLAHGGLQIQIEQTMAAVAEAGANVQPLRWWDASQKGEVLHHFGRVPEELLRAAHGKGLRVVQEELLTEQGSRSRLRLLAEKLLRKSGRHLLPGSLINAHNWAAYRLADASIANTPWEARLMIEVYGAPAARVHVVPNGVEEIFLKSEPVARDKWLVCTATVTERKRVCELAAAAVIAQTPLWIIGKPYSEKALYFRKFLELVEANRKVLRYEGAVNDRAELAGVYKTARGFVLLSAMETRSLAAEEAAACETPLLLSDLPWARSVFGAHARYCAVPQNSDQTAAVLREFYEAAPRTSPPPKPLSWVEVGRKLMSIYETVLR